MPTPNRLKVLFMLALSCIFSLSLLYLRFYFSNSTAYQLLIWNLFLAAIPLFISTLLLLTTRWLPGILLFGMVALWLLFFPNAPYICTDFIHLRSRQPIPLWFDALLLLSFAWNGLFLGFISLLDVQRVLSFRFGKAFAWIFIISAMLLGSFGIYLGRFLRWNSWDVFTRPVFIIKQLLHLHNYSLISGITLFLFFFLLFAYLTVKQIAESHKPEA